MDWKEAAAAFSHIEEKDLESFSLSAEDMEEVLLLYNRSVANAKESGADIALIALKKLLIRYPNWGDATLLYGICLALEEEFIMAKESFLHAQQLGFLSIHYTDLVHYCLQEIEFDIRRQRRRLKEQENDNRGIASVFAKKKDSTIFSEKNAKTMIPAQTPILTRAPKNAKKVRFASDRERRDIMMQGNAPSGEIQEEAIDLAIPKTPSEKLRVIVLILSGVAGAVLLAFLVWFLVIPRVFPKETKDTEQTRLFYMLALLEENRSITEIDEVLELYLKKYPDDIEIIEKIKEMKKESGTEPTISQD